MKILSSLITILIILSTPLSAFSRDYQVVDVIGDSLSAGLNPDYGTYGWVQMLYGEGGGSYPEPKQNTIDDFFPGITKYNSAVSGSTAGTWTKPESGYLDLVKSHQPDLVFLYIGGNDFISNSMDGCLSEGDIQRSREHITYILEELEALPSDPDIIMLNYYDAFDGFSSSATDELAQFCQMSTGMPAGNELLYELAQEHGCYFIDNFNGFFHHGYGKSFGDSQHLLPDYFKTPLENFDIHPATSGHDYIYQNVYTKLQEIKSLTPVENWNSEGY